MFNFTAFIRRKWAEYSAASGQKGTAVDELAVKPTALVMADFNNTLVDQRTTNDIENWEKMTDEQLDFFGNKFFYPRINGDYAFGTARIWFNEKKNILIDQEVRFITEDGYKYIATQPRTVSRSEFKNSTDRFALYYVDVPIIATSKGNQFNANAGGIVQIENADFTYQMVSNVDEITSGSKYESNEEYYERLIYSLNDRSMMNKSSIYANLPVFFPVVKAIYIAAPGDKYMMRDLVSGIDTSLPPQKADFLGKISGENMIKHIAFYGIYPPETGDDRKETWGPFSIITEYKYPLTIEPTDTTASISSSGQNGDPGFHGYPSTQEFSDDLYKGVYFDDYKTSSEIFTKELFNIEDEDVGFEDLIVPSSEWVYGAHGNQNGDIGLMYDDFGAEDILKFNNNNIILSSGAKNNIMVGRDIEKRVGVKLTGIITFPAIDNPEEVAEGEDEEELFPSNTNLQVMIGGVNSSIADGYTGVGFGVRLTGHYDEDDENAIIYIAHGEKYGQAQVFAANDDIQGTEPTSTDGHISITDMGALAEWSWLIEPGVPYEFEFILHDDLKVTLYLNRTSGTISGEPDKNTRRIELPKTALNVYSQELFKASSDHYGTTMKIALDAISDEAHTWTIGNLRAVDTQESRATALFALNTKDIDDPATISMRAFGSGSVDGSRGDGYLTYIWDKEASSAATGTTELTSGAWTQLPAVSNPNGSKDVITNMLSHTIQNLDRYQVDSRYGKNIFLMLIASGTSKFNSKYANEYNQDIQSRLRIDYLKLQSDSFFYYHANNKSDIYLATIKNSEELEATSTVLTKTINENYFEMSLDTDAKMPIENIRSVTIGTTVSETDTLAETDYSIIHTDENYKGSSKEIVRIVLDNSDADTITVEYTTYPEVENIQNFFDNTEHEKLYGDILIKHKVPVHLSFTMFFTGEIGDDQLIDEIRTYVDNNIDGTFSTREMVSYLYNENFVNNVQEPIEISYTQTNDEGIVETGTFTDTHTIRDIDYFRINDLSVSRL